MALLARPDHIFEANFFNTDDGPVWTDLTSYVELQEGIAAGKRRQNVFDNVAPATFSIFLDNSAGTFNNDKVTSPYCGLVNLDVPVRFRLRWPNCPSATNNMLSDVQSNASDQSKFTVDQGSIDIDTATPSSGQTSDIIWTTGALGAAGASVITGVGPARSPDDHPIYVLPNTTYSARVQVKDDANGTGITFQVSARIRWYDATGNIISDTSSTATTLTTSYQAITVSGTSPSNAVTARLGVFNETVVGPATAAITFDGSDVQTQHWGTSMPITVPQSVDVSDVIIVVVRANANVTINTPTGWTLKSQWSDTTASKGKTAVFFKIATATDIGKTYRFTTSAACGFQVFITCYDGTDYTTPIHQYATGTESTFRTTHTTPSVTTTLANCWIVQVAFDTSSTTTLWGAPGSYNIRNLGYRTGGNSPTGCIADNGTAVGTGTYGAGVFTANSSSKYASMVTLALAPATGTGPGTVTLQIGAWELVQGSLTSWTQGGTWASKFTGQVDSWTETFSGDLVLMDVKATDRQKILTTINIGSAVYETIRAAGSGPVAYYKLDESSSGTGTTQEAGNYAHISQDTLKQKQFGTGGVINWGQGVGPVIDGTAAVMFAPADNYNNGIGLSTVLTNPIVASDAVTLVTFWNSAMSDSNYHMLIRMQDATNGANPRCQLQIQARPTAGGAAMIANALITSEAATYQALATKATSYYDGKTHCLVATFQLLGGQLISTMFIDGVQQAQATLACPLAQFPTLSIMSVGCGGSTAYLGSGTYSHAAVFNDSLDPSDIADINTAGTTAFAGDTVDQRIGRLCDWENQVGLDLDTSATVLARHMPDDKTLQSAIQLAALSEGGTAYVDGDGNVAFKSRVDKESTASPLITVAASRVDPSSFAKITDDALLVNRVLVKRLDTQVVSTFLDVPSRDVHGTYEKPFDTLLSNNDDATSFGTYVLAFYSEPKPRCDQVVIEGLILQDWPDVLQIDMWQVLRITGLPTTEQSTTLDFFIEGWQLDLNEDSWKLTFDTSTAIPFGILNDATRGVCGASVVGW
jgi:hypothetical protein